MTGGPLCDLFGEPIDPRRGARGRPRHFPTEAARDQARRMHAAGFAQPAIAAALRITEPTLRRHYWREIGSRAVIAGCYEE